MARLDMPIGVWKHPGEAGACGLCPDGGHGRALSLCPVLESPVCEECCTRMWSGDPYRLLLAASRLLEGHDLTDLLHACLQCSRLHLERSGDAPSMPPLH